MTTVADTDDRTEADVVEPAPGRRWLRPGRRRWLLVGAGVVVFALLAAWLVAYSPAFAVRHVEVLGANQVGVAAVEEAADVAHGTPLLQLDTSAVVARVERLADVRSATARTSFPSTLIITVVARRPVGYLRDGRRDVLVDSTGAKYRTVSRLPGKLPRLVLPSDASASTTAAAASVAAALPQELLRHIASVQALDPQAITLLLRGERVVHWGSAAQSAAKARVLPVLLRTSATQIDVSNPAQPFTR